MKKQTKKPAATPAKTAKPSRLPAGAPDPFDPPPDPWRVRRFVELLDEWERKAAADDWPEYADALAADREAEADARAELAARGENPAALLSHDPAAWEWERLRREEFSLDPAAFAAAKKIREARTPSNAADVETVARIEAKVDELAARKRKASKRAREAGAAGGKESARQRADGERKRIRAAALGRMRRGIAAGKSMKQAARDALRKGEPLLKSNGEPLREDSLVRYFKAAKSKGGA